MILAYTIIFASQFSCRGQIYEISLLNNVQFYYAAFITILITQYIFTVLYGS